MPGSQIPLKVFSLDLNTAFARSVLGNKAKHIPEELIVLAPSSEQASLIASQIIPSSHLEPSSAKEKFWHQPKELEQNQPDGFKLISGNLDNPSNSSPLRIRVSKNNQELQLTNRLPYNMATKQPISASQLAEMLS